MHIHINLRRTVLQPAATHFKIKLVDIKRTANAHAQVWAETWARRHTFSFKKKTFRAGLPRCLVLIRATLRAEVDVIGFQRC